MTFVAIVIVTALGTPTFQLDDTVNPPGYKQPAECWLRVAHMVRSISTKIPVTNAIGVCVSSGTNKSKPTSTPELGA